MIKKGLFIFFILILLSNSVYAATRYVDSDVSSSGNGQSWATAWKAISNITGLSAGDIVYFSGGTTSKTYNVSGWAPPGGNSGGVITYRTGQDAGHNGTVIFSGGSNWLRGNLSYVKISGDVGGARHMTVQNYSDFVWLVDSGQSVSHVTLQAIDFPNMRMSIRFSNGSSTTAIEIDNCRLDKVYAGSDGWGDDIIYNLNGSGYDSHRIHHSEFYTRAYTGDSAWGDDGIKWGSGISFYNNYVKVILSSSYPRNPASSQHGDFFQIGDGYYKIYNNVFEDVGESIIYHDRFGNPASLTGLLFYNNVLVWTKQNHSGVARGLDLQPEGAGVGTRFTDFIVANNTFVDWTGGVFLVRINNATSYTRCAVRNNIAINCSTGFTLDPGIAESNNTSSSSVKFVSYAPYQVTTNDFHLQATDTIAKDQGYDMSAYYVTDKDGNARTGTWDIGAYEYGTGGSYTTLTVSKSGTGTGTVTSSPSGIYCGATCSAYANGTTFTLTATPDSGHSFSGWSGGGCSGTGSCVVNVNAETTITATFAPPPPAGNYNLTVNKSGTGSGTASSSPAGIDCGSTCSAAYAGGTSVSLIATPVSGHSFAGWSGGGCSGTGSCIMKVNMDSVVTATFSPPPPPNSYNLVILKSGTGTGTVSSAPSGINCGSSCSSTYTSGIGVTLTATSDSGYTFVGWSGGDCSGKDTCVVTMSADTTVTATFSTPAAKGRKKLHIIKSGTGMGMLLSSPAGVDCGPACEAEYDEGTEVTLTDNTIGDHSFVGWSGGGCSGNGVCVVIMNADTTVTALFSSSGGSGGGGGCFIATAAYGSYLDPHVGVLRNFRDRYLLTNFIGKAFVDFYYRYSPPVAAFIGRHETLKVATRWALTPVVGCVEHPYTAASILLMIPAGIILTLRRRKVKRSH